MMQNGDIISDQQAHIVPVSDEGDIQALIKPIRGVQVILDRDVARLYGVATGALNRQVKRNEERFPEDFMFRLSAEEWDNLKCQIGISSWGGDRQLPYAFTENGIAMLSSVLRSPTAIEANIRIMRAFSAMRRFLLANAQMFQRIEAVEKRQIATDAKVDSILQRIDATETPIQGVFYDGQLWDARALVLKLIQSAKRSLILIDNWATAETLDLFAKKRKGVKVTIFTSEHYDKKHVPHRKISDADIKTFNAQYPKLAVRYNESFHDRFLFIDDKELYLIGASLKDLGRKCFAFTKLYSTNIRRIKKLAFAVGTVGTLKMNTRTMVAKVKKEHVAKIANSRMQLLRYAEFCTGVGGFRLGIEASSLKCQLVYSNEINEACEQTYYRNFKKRFDSKDLLALNPSDVPDFDMICAGFPCQPFSIAGKELGFDDPRGSIFFKLLEIIRAKAPKIVFLENVVNLVRHDGGKTYRRILELLDGAGYEMSPKILECSYFGVPQSRSRIYIIGLSRKVFGNLHIEFTERLTERTSFRKFIDRNEKQGTVSKRWNEYIDLYTGDKSLDEMTFDVPRTRRVLERVAKGCDLHDCIFQSRSSGIRAVSLDEPFPTFTVLNSGGGAHVPVLSHERRHLSISEMKSIMGFPKWYDFSAVARTDAAKQLANAVCPPVITSICNDINRFCFGKAKRG